MGKEVKIVRRILFVLTVALVIAALMAMNTAPTFAASPKALKGQAKAYCASGGKSPQPVLEPACK